MLERAHLIVGLTTVAVLAAGVVVPGGGLAVALVGRFTWLREYPRASRWMLVLGGALLVLAVGVYAFDLPWTQPVLQVDPAVPAGSAP